MWCRILAGESNVSRGSTGCTGVCGHPLPPADAYQDIALLQDTRNRELSSRIERVNGSMNGLMYRTREASSCGRCGQQTPTEGTEGNTLCCRGALQHACRTCRVLSTTTYDVQNAAFPTAHPLPPLQPRHAKPPARPRTQHRRFPVPHLNRDVGNPAMEKLVCPWARGHNPQARMSQRLQLRHRHLTSGAISVHSDSVTPYLVNATDYPPHTRTHTSVPLAQCRTAATR